MKNKVLDTIDLFIFDMDGILFDTETVYFGIWKKAFKGIRL